MTIQLNVLYLCGFSVSATFIKTEFLLLLEYFHEELCLFFDTGALGIKRSLLLS